MNVPINSVAVKFYDRTTLAEIIDPANDGARVVIERAGTMYPCGFGAASLFIKRDPTAPLPYNGGDMVRLYNGQRVVYEGYIASIGHIVGASESGIRLNLRGAWGEFMSRTKEKRWADSRTTPDVWEDYSYGGIDTNRDGFSANYTGRLRIDTKNKAYAAFDGHSMVYTMPIGETVKRVKCSGNLQEGGQQYTLRLYNRTAAANVWFKSASGTFTQDDTFATPSRIIQLQLYSDAAQTGTSDGTTFGQIDNAVSGATALMVYSETGNINCLEVFKDVRAMVPELSSDETLIDTSLTVTIEPFISQGREALGSILARIASYGTSTYGAIGYGIKDGSQSSDGKPILFAEPWPTLTDYEYEIAFSDKQLGDSLEIVRDYAGIINWVVVEYQDPANGNIITLTPDDDANLKDQTSIDTYGERQSPQPLRVGYSSQAIAVYHARRLLAARKDPQVYISGSITYRGTINGKLGQKHPVANIVAGERCKIVDFVSDVIDVAGAGLTAVITATEYSDANGGSVRLSFGIPDNLAVMLARGAPAIASMLASGAGRTFGGLSV